MECYCILIYYRNKQMFYMWGMSINQRWLKGLRGLTEFAAPENLWSPSLVLWGGVAVLVHSASPHWFGHIQFYIVPGLESKQVFRAGLQRAQDGWWFFVSWGLCSLLLHPKVWYEEPFLPANSCYSTSSEPPEGHIQTLSTPVPTSLASVGHCRGACISSHWDK